MRKIRIMAMIVAMTLCISVLAGCRKKPSAVAQNDEIALSGDTKVLVVYFSWSGNLQKMSHWIAEETGGDIIRVLASDPYPEDYDETADRAKKEKDEGIRPAITIDLTAEEIAKYDTIFLGFPVWWYDLPMPMWTFLESVDLEGKTVIPFFSHEGSSTGASSLDTIKRLAEGADVKTDDALSIRGGKVAGSEETVRNWVRDLGYGK
ncbi:MAG: NAD(P)H-dependent oxidoreductase [Clostridiales bacterium]|nr:NAD(P)H-dependent oxidoreductase [Clostridiales bacterium]